MTTLTKSSSAHRPATELAFETNEAVTEPLALQVRGQIPDWLTGQLFRNGPGRWEFDQQQANHWFDGMALIHCFTIEDGGVSYSSRFIESRAYLAACDTGKLRYAEFASDPCRTRFQKIAALFNPGLTDNPAVSTFEFGERMIALSETPMAYEFDPATLETLGVAYENPDTFATAHPHAGEGGSLINLSCKLGARNSQSFFSVDPTTLQQTRIARLPRSRPTYQHSFGITDRWIVFTEFPFKVNPLDIVRSGRPFIENFKFAPEDGTTLTLIDRQSGEIGGVWEAGPGFCFHHANSYEEGEDVVVDLCRFDNPAVVENLYVDKLRGGEYPAEASPFLHRYRLTPGSGRAEESRISDEPIDLPRINYARCNGKPYRYVYGVGLDEGSPLDRLVKIDVTSQAATIWREANAFVGEPVFLAAPNAEREDDGVLLSLVLDGDAGRSMLLVLDASDMTELARAEVTSPLAPGFHGSFVRSRAS